LAMSNKRKSAEPFWWALFGAGGVISAFILPALVIFFGIMIPLGLAEAPPHEALYGVVSHPISRLILMAVISLSLFHWAHRFRFTLYDGLQVKHLDSLIAVTCYGGAIAGSAVIAYILITF